MAGPGNELGCAGSRAAKRGKRRVAHGDGRRPLARLELDRRNERGERSRGAGARVDRRGHTGRHDVGRTRLDLEPADGRDRPGPGRLPNTEHERRSLDERVGASIDRGGAGVVGATFEDLLPARLPDDRGDDPERCADTLEHWPLLDVELEEGQWQPAGGDAGAASPTAALLVTKRDNGEREREALRRLDRSDYAEDAVEAAAVWHRVEMGANPDRTVATAAERVAGRVDSHLETRFGKPAGDKRVRSILGGGASDPCRADRVHLVEAFEHSSHDDIVAPAPCRRRAGRPRLGGRVRFPHRRRWCRCW